MQKSRMRSSVIAACWTIAGAAFVITLVCRPMIYRGSHRDQNRRIARAQMKNFAGAIEQYRRRHDGAAPDSLEALVVPDTANFNESYLGQEEVPFDPWDRPYRYGADGGTYTIVCLGGDGLVGGEGNDEDWIVASTE